MLTERRRLADLGLAVSKINHDLRNLLSSAHLLSERLDMIADPHVQRIAPKIVRAIDRAVSFCEATLAYGQVREQAPGRSTFALAQLVEEAAEFAGLAGHKTVAFRNAVDPALAVRVGRDNLFRIPPQPDAQRTPRVGGGGRDGPPARPVGWRRRSTAKRSS